MAKNSIADWDTTAENNTDIASINIAENCPPSSLNNAQRTVMAQLKAWYNTVTAWIAAPFIGSKTVAGNADLPFYSNGSGSVKDALIRASGGNGSDYGGKITLASSILNVQGKSEHYKPFVLDYTAAGDNYNIGGMGMTANTYKTGTAGGVGYRFHFKDTGAVTGGAFSLATELLGNWTNINASFGQTLWAVAQSPDNITNPWAISVSEFNPINLGADPGLSLDLDTVRNLVGGLRMVPEGTDLLAAVSSKSGYNISYGFSVSESSRDSAGQGYHPATYIPFFVEDDATAPDGIAFQASGGYSRVGAGQLPAFAFRASRSYSTALFDTRDATVTNNRAITLLDGHKICFNTTSNALYSSSGVLTHDDGGSARKIINLTSFTPTFGSESGSGATFTLVDATYSQAQGMVRGQITVQLTAVGTASGGVTFTLPKSPNKGSIVTGFSTITGKVLIAPVLVGNTTAKVNTYDASSIWTNGTYFVFTFAYAVSD